MDLSLNISKSQIAHTGRRFNHQIEIITDIRNGLLLEWQCVHSARIRRFIDSVRAYFICIR